MTQTPWSVGLEGHGLIVGAKYRLAGLLGQGAIACVYEATHIELGGQVALKFLKPQCAREPEIVARFEQEAKAVARLRGPHIAAVMDIGKHDDIPFIAMEYLSGKDLRALIVERGPMPIADVADILIQACAALAEAHAQGIVHRDIKPDNLFMVDPEQSWKSIKVLDFGISKLAEHASDPGSRVKTAANQMVGSPHYMSPEQVKSSRDVDGRTDLWSLGVVAYELWSGGERPFVGENLAMLVMSILCNPPRSPSVHRPNDATFLNIIHRCLSKSIDERFQSAADLAFALLPFAPERAVQSVERARFLTPGATFAVTEVIRQRDESAAIAETARAESVRARLRAGRLDFAHREREQIEVSSAATIPVPSTFRMQSKVAHNRKIGS